LEGADFRLATGLTITQIRRAHGWEQATYNPKFAQELDLTKAEETTPQENHNSP